MNKPSLQILLIEDNRAIAKQLCKFFEGLGWSIDYSETGAHGVSLACSNHYDLVLLDLNLPDIDGVEVCEKIKASADSNVPILMLTARDAFEDKAEGFESGADDYVTKPFEFRELALRCQALSRRTDLHRAKVIQVGELKIDKAKHVATRKGSELKLTNIGFDILLVLSEAYPDAVTRSALIAKIWGNEPPDSDTLRAHIYSLRNVLDKPFSSAMLKTLINVGYKLVVDDV